MKLLRLIAGSGITEIHAYHHAIEHRVREGDESLLQCCPPGMDFLSKTRFRRLPRKNSFCTGVIALALLMSFCISFLVALTLLPAMSPSQHFATYLFPTLLIFLLTLSAGHALTRGKLWGLTIWMILYCSLVITALALFVIKLIRVDHSHLSLLMTAFVILVVTRGLLNSKNFLTTVFTGRNNRLQIASELKIARRILAERANK